MRVAEDTGRGAPQVRIEAVVVVEPPKGRAGDHQVARASCPNLLEMSEGGANNTKHAARMKGTVGSADVVYAGGADASIEFLDGYLAALRLNVMEVVVLATSSQPCAPRWFSTFTFAAAGVAPLAARSERFTATSFQPTEAGGSVLRK